jgi:uncharacterized protein YbcI
MSEQQTQMTKGELEASFTKEVAKFEKEYLGRGPVDARTYLIDNVVLVRLHGMLTPAEEKLIENQEGRSLVKNARRQLFETSRPILEEFVNRVLDAKVIDLFSDFSTDTGERVIVLTVDKNFGK